MSPVAAFLTRLALDDAFRDAFAAAPDACLAALPLTDAERAVLRRPDPAWLGLLATAVRQVEVPEGPAWDPAQAVPSPAATAATAPTGVAATTGPFAGLPEAAVYLRLVGAERPDGRPAWAATLLGAPPDEPPPHAEVRLVVRVVPDAAGARVDVQPVTGADPEPGPAVAPWGHRTDTRAVRADARAAADGSIEAVRALVDRVADGGAPADDEPAPAPPAIELLDDAVAPADVTVVGVGIRGVDQLTREGEAALRRAREVFYVDAGLAVGAFLRGLGPTVTPLFAEAYAGGAGRGGTYRHIAARVLAGALRHRPVCLVVQGHPTVFSYAPLLVRDAGAALGLRVRILPGVSADGAIFAALGVDPCDHGLQAYEATDLLLRRRPIAADAAALIWQAGNVETRLHTARPSTPARFRRLTDWLLRFYPAQHPVRVVRIGVHPGVATVVRTVALAELPSLGAALDAATTLYLPPIGRRPILDAELAAQVDDPAHLAAITRPG
jgi:precorrin-3B methylase